MLNKILSITLVLCMLLSMLPVGVFAAEESAGSAQDVSAPGSNADLQPDADAPTPELSSAHLDTAELQEGEVSALAETISGTCGDNLTWTLNAESGVLTISGTGAMKDYVKASYVPWYYVSSSIKMVVIEDGVTRIGDRAFYWCTGLTNVTIPDSVTSIGDYAFFDCESLIAIAIPDSISSIEQGAFECCFGLTDIVIPGSVTSIGDYAFANCSGLVSITIPDTVTSMGYAAFLGCTSLTSVTIPSSVTTIAEKLFEDCSSLTGISIPDGVTSVGEYAFSGCSNLTSITIPDSVTYIASDVFYQCEKLTWINYTGTEDQWNAISKASGWNSYMGPACVCYLGECEDTGHVWVEANCIRPKQCANCGYVNGEPLGHVYVDDLCSVCGERRGSSGLVYSQLYDENGKIAGYEVINIGECIDVEVIIPSSYNGWPVIKIGFLAFSGCNTLTSIIIPDSVTDIDYGAFSDCSNLTSITIPDSVASIGESAFSGCNSLTDITIPDSVTSIGGAAFANCTSLTDITIPDSVTTISGSAFASCTSLTSITIPDSVTSLGNYAFSNCTSLDSAILGDGVTNIGDSAFSECTSLASVTIGNGVTSIGNRAFVGCTSLTNITIPDGVTSLGDSAFSGCTSLTSIVIPESVTLVGSGAFDSCISLTSIIIPKGATIKGSYTFQNCRSLTTVYLPVSIEYISWTTFNACPQLTWINFYGTKEQWDAIGKDSQWDEYLASYTVCCLGECESTGHVWENANCTEPTRCVGCGYAVGDPLGHTYVDNICSVCGERRASDGLIFSRVYDYDSGEYIGYTVDGIGECVDTEVVIPSKYNGRPVVAISDYAFGGCDAIIRIIIPQTVTHIGVGAFAECSSLASINIPESITTMEYRTFFNCTNLTNIMIPDSVTSIGAEAFTNCRRLIGISIPDSVTSIEYSTFSGCSSLRNIALPSRITSIGEYAFADCSGLISINIPDGVTAIESHTFSGCSSLRNITIPSRVTSIGEYAFADCSGLISINIPDGVTAIESNTFYNCSSLMNINIPDGVTTFGHYAFDGCCSLTSITIPDGVTSIGGNAFASCGRLTNITIPDSVTSIGGGAFRYCASLIKIAIPDGITTIGDYTFEGCTSLTSIVIPESVTSFGDGAFDGCCSLTSITIPKSITSIERYTFYKCSSLTTITIPAGVTNIGYIAFGRCNNLSEIRFAGTIAQWEAISKDSMWDYLSDYVLYCFGECEASGHSWMEATCTQAKYCVNCGLTEGDALGHSIVDNVCNVCGHWSYSQGLEYTLSEDGAYYIVSGMGTCTDQDLIIPAMYEGLPVTVIGRSAFEWEAGIKSVTFPGTVTTIQSYAFQGCSALKKLNFSDGLDTIGYGAFSYCDSLINVVIPASVTTIGSIIFDSCENLVSVHISSGVTSIDGGFGKCEDLAKITVDEANTTYCAVDNVLYTKDMTTLVIYPENRPGAVFTIPNTVATIGDDAFYRCSRLRVIVLPEGLTTIKRGAFSKCTNLRSIVIPEGVTSISEWAFFDCTSLTDITIPDSVTSIGDSAFFGCAYLWHVLYKGTEEQWNGISIGSNNTYLANVTRHYNCVGDEIINPVEKICSICSGECQHDWQDATCTTPKTCSVCGATEGEALGHAYESVVTQPTCDAAGYTTYTCSVCGDSYTADKTEDTGHNYVDGVCTVCGEAEEVVKPDWPTLDNIQQDSFAFYVFCSQHGNDEGILCVCFAEDYVTLGDIVQNEAGEWTCEVTYRFMEYMENVVMQEIFLEHAMVTEVPETTTYTLTWNSETALWTYTGDNIGWFYEVAPALDDDECEHYSAVAVPGTAPTCTEPGLTEGSVCEYCGEVLVAQEVIPATGHSYVDGVCTVCGTALVYSEGLEYTLSEDGTYYIVSGIGTCTDTDLVIPATYNRLPVQEIGAWAFRDCTSLTSVTIPDSVFFIGEEVFSDCSSLTSVTIPDSVFFIGAGAFSGCTGLTGVTIPSSVSYIGICAFQGCENLSSVTIESGVTMIAEQAFSICNALTSVTIPDSVTAIGSAAFAGCASLEEFVVDDGNTVYCAVDGVLYTKDMTTLVVYPAGKEAAALVVPDSVYRIYILAFAYCENLTSVTFENTEGWYAATGENGTLVDVTDPVANASKLTNNYIYDFLYRSTEQNFSEGLAYTLSDDGTYYIVTGNGRCTDTDLVIPATYNGLPVQEIGNLAFYFYGLTSITIPGSVSGIGHAAFWNCTSLQDIYFGGTEEQWNAIEKAEDWDAVTGGYTVHFGSACAHSYEAVVTAPTCTAQGYTTYTCALCGDSYVADYVDADPNAHTFTCTVEALPTTDAGGLLVASCNESGCPYVQYVILPALNTIDYTYEIIKASTYDTTGIGRYTWNVTDYGEVYFDVTLDVISETDPQIVIGSVIASAGDTVTVEVYLKNNPGIGYLNIALSYDTSALTLLSATNGVLLDTMNQGLNLVWDASENVAADGLLCTLTFQIAEEAAEGEYTVSAKLNEAYNDNWEDVSFAMVSGTVEVVNFLYGDANGDGEVDGKDLLLLRRYMANYNFGTGESAIDVESGADANGDGTVNGKDLLLMRRYMANYNFSTGESTIVLGPEKSEEDLSGTYDVTLWVSENDGAVELILQQIAAFEAANPGIVINASIESVADYNAANNIVADVASAPDIYCITQERLALLVQIGALSPLDANAAAAVKTANSTDSVAAASVSGNLYAYPMTSDNGYFMYYDTSIITEEDAESMEAIIAACEKAGLKFRFALDNAWYSTSFFFGTGCHSNWTWDAEGNLIGADDTFNSAAGLAAMKGMQMLAQSTCHDSNADIFTDAAVVITGVWNAYAAANHFGENLGATDLPSFTVDGQTYHLGSFAGNKLMGVKPQTDAQKQAVLHLLAQYLTNEECQMARYDQFGWIPSNLKAQASEDVQSNISVAAMINQHKFSQPQRQIPNFWWDTAKMLGVEAENATIDADLQTALDNYSDAINDVLGMTKEEKEAWSVIGGICGTCWDTDIPMTKIDDVTWESEPLELKAGEQFKVRRGGSWDLNFGVEFQGENVVVEADGTYIVRFIWYGGEDGIVTLIPAEEEEAWSVIGNICGTSWDTDIPMTKIDDVTWESEPLELHAREEFKVRRGGSWDLNFGAEFQGANVVVEADGTYIVRLVWYGGEDGTVALIPVVIAKYTEAPYITNLGIYGNVEDRLPVEDDIFVSLTDATGAALEIGTYGGTINLISGGGSWDISRPTLETIIRRNSDGTYYPNVIKSYEYNDDYTVWTFHLREGMKWSDGDDFNADDITFWYYMCHLTNFSTKRSWTALKDGKDAEGNDQYAVLTKVDDYTVTWTFQNPKFPADFIENGDFKWCWAPSHWLINMIPDSIYVENPYWAKTGLSDEEVLNNAKEKGVDKSTIKALGKELTYYFWNVGGMPTLNAFVLRAGESRSDTVVHLDRNPYYWKVDAQGQQLPYCDGIVMTKISVEGQDQLMFRSGELDLIGVAMQDIASILADMGDKAVLRTFTSVDWGKVKITFNYTHTDPNYANLFNNIKFRQAVSIAVDRNAVSELLTDGFLLPGQCAPQAGNFGYDEEWINKWTEYDVATAKKLLEECGLVMGDDGFYNFADGSDLEIVFYSYLESGAANEYPILEQYFNAVGLKTAWKEFEVAAFDTEIDNNTWTAVLDPHTSIGGLSMKYRAVPFVPIAQAAEWYGEFGTWYQTNGEQGVEPTGDMAKLIEIYELWNATPNSDEKDAFNLEIYKIHKENLWTIAYLQSAGLYNLVSSAIGNHPDNLVSSDLHMYTNIVHYENLYKVQ